MTIARCHEKFAALDGKRDDGASATRERSGFLAALESAGPASPSER